MKSFDVQVTLYTGETSKHAFNTKPERDAFIRGLSILNWSKYEFVETVAHSQLSKTGKRSEKKR